MHSGTSNSALLGGRLGGELRVVILAAFHLLLDLIVGFFLQALHRGDIGLSFSLAAQLREDPRPQVMNGGAIRIDGNGVIDGS